MTGKSNGESSGRNAVCGRVADSRQNEAVNTRPEATFSCTLDLPSSKVFLMFLFYFKDSLF